MAYPSVMHEVRAYILSCADIAVSKCWHAKVGIPFAFLVFGFVAPFVAFLVVEYPFVYKPPPIPGLRPMGSKGCDSVRKHGTRTNHGG